MSTDNTTPVNSYKTEITALLDSAINTADKSNGIAAKLAVVLWNAANTQEVDSAKLLGYAGGGWSKTAKGLYIDEMAREYSSAFRSALDIKEAFKAEKNETKKREMRDLADRHIRAARLTLIRSLSVAAWFHEIKPTGITVKSNGSIRMQHENEEYNGAVYTRVALEDLARKFFRPFATSNRKGSTGGTLSQEGGTVTPGVAGASLKTVAEFITNSVSGKEPGAFGKETDQVLQLALATLLGYFGSNATGGLDLRKIDQLYKHAAK